MEISNRNKKVLNLIIGILLLFAILSNCKKKEEVSSNEPEKKAALSGVVLFIVGDVKSGSKKLKVGDVIAENETVQTGKKSACDLQINNSDAGIVMRMKSDSTFYLKTTVVKGKETPGTMLSSGVVLINVSNKLKAEESFNVITPTMVAGVRGTKFEVSIKNDGSTAVVVSEGKVATVARIEEVEGLPLEIQEQSKTIISVKEILSGQEQILEAGQEIEITKKQTNKILYDSGLGDTVKNNQYNTSAKLSELEVKNAVASIDKNFKPEGNTESLTKKSVADNASSKMKPVSDSNIQKKLAEFSELIAIERKKLESSESKTLALKERNELNKAGLIKRIEEITGKTMETFILKSGKKIKGIIFLEGDIWHVITHDGEETYKESEVEGFEL